MYLFLSLALSLFPLSLSGNTAPDVSNIYSVSENTTVSDNEIVIPDIKEEIIDDGIEIPDTMPNSGLPVENTDIPKIENDELEIEVVPEIFYSVSNNYITVSDNSVSLNDILPMEESLFLISRAMNYVAANIEPTLSTYQVSEYYVNYFRGVIQNMPYTDYICYAERVMTGSSYNNYTTHYYLLYDLEFNNDGTVVEKAYPCIDVYSENNIYYAKEINKRFTDYPTFGYASFRPYSALFDRSFNYGDLYVGLICVVVLFLIGRKTLFS